MGLKGLMDKLNDAIREPVTVSPAAETPKGPQPPPRAPTGASAYAGTTIGAGADSASVKQFTDLLREATDDDRSPGQVQFTSQLKALETAIPHDVGTRYKAAAATSGVKAGDLLKSVTAIEGQLDGEAAEFENTVAAVEAQDIGGARHQVQGIETEVKNLEQRLSELRKQSEKLSSGITEAERCFAKKRQDFAAALGAIRAELATEKNLITTHLGGS